MTLSADALASICGDIEHQGYAIVRDVVPGDFVDRIVAKIRELLAEPATDRRSQTSTEFKGSATHTVRNILSKGSVFEDAAQYGPVQQVAERVLSPGFAVFATAVVEVGPGERPQRLHADDVLVRLPRPFPAPLIMNTIWALTDFTEDNGATRLVPGSHRFDHLPPPGATPDTVSALMPRGSILMYNGSMWHGANRNVTLTAARLGMTISYCAPFIRPYENQLKLIPIERARQMSPVMRRLIGYDYWVPPDLTR